MKIYINNIFKRYINKGLQRTYYIPIIALCFLSLISCVGEDFNDCNSEGINMGGISSLPNCYIQLNINFPTEVSSRSTTKDDGSGNSYDGTKDAIAAENAINSLHLYFFDNSNSTDKGKFLCELSATTTDLTVGTGANANKHTFTQKVEIANLKKILGKKLRIYALANLSSYPTVTETTTEADFLNNYYSGTSYTGAFAETSESTTTYGRNCPMANYDYFEGDFEAAGSLGENPTDSEVILAAEKIFTGAYTGTNAKPGDKLYTFSNALELERMVARLDFKAAEGETINGEKYDYVYKLPNAECTITACNSSDGGVYLQLADLTVNKITGSAYYFRHTAAGNSLAAGTPLKVFGKENVDGSTDTPSGADEEDEDGDGEGNEETPELPSYNWIASHNWTSSRSYTSSDAFTPSEICAWLTSGDSYVEKTEWYSPWYYVNENTVSSTADMDLDHCTYIEFKFLLWDATTQLPYKKPTVSGGTGEDTQAQATADTEEEVRITMTGGDKNGYYKILGSDKDGYYLIYKYMIPHHLPTPSGSVDGDTGSLTGTKAPMQYGVVRNNVYQIGFNGLTSLPSPHEPDNFYLSINIKILAWVKRDITVSW